MNLSELQRMVQQGDLSAEAAGYLLDCRAECEWLDYKEKITLDTDHGLAAFVRDVLAMANTGGGYIVVGVADKTWQPVGIGHDLPFDGKLLRDKVRRGSGVDVDVDIVHHVVVRDGVPRRFAVILIRGPRTPDARTPLLVHTDFQPNERYGLRRGDIYARRGDSTVKVDSAEMLDGLLSRISAPARAPARRPRRGLRAVTAGAICAAAAIAGTTAYLHVNAGGPKVPLTVAVEVFDPVCGSDWIIPRPATPADFPSDQGVNWRDLPGIQDGAIASPGWVLLFVQGRSDAEVLITDLVVRVVQRRAPIQGSLLHRQCGDQGAYRFLEADLDTDPPKVESRFHADAADESDPKWMLTPIRFPYKVSTSEAEAFSVEATTDGCDCDWYIELSWASEGRTGVLHIDDEGQPFRTTSRVSAREA